MTPVQRTPQPDFLRSHSRRWGAEFKRRRDANPSASFSWRTHFGQDTAELLRAELEVMSDNHCCFCDGYPLGTTSRQTIEHFRPKSLYPRLAYTWLNLFLCCDACQQEKLEKYETALLKPDVAGFRFEDYFINEYKTGKILVNPAASHTNQLRADRTIEIYGLNRRGRPESRKTQRRHYQNQRSRSNPSEFAYRFFIT